MPGRHVADHQVRLFMEYGRTRSARPRRRRPASRSHRHPHQAGPAGRHVRRGGGGDARGGAGPAPGRHPRGVAAAPSGAGSGCPAHPGAAGRRPEGAARPREGGDLPAAALTGPDGPACLHPHDRARRRPAGQKPGHMPCRFRLPWSGFRHVGQVQAARASRRRPPACRRRSGSRAGPRRSTGQATCLQASAIPAGRMPGT